MLLIVLVAAGGLAVLAVVGVLLVVSFMGQRALAPPLAAPSITLPEPTRETGGGNGRTPTEQQRKDFMFKLATIAPWLLDEDINISAAEQTCADIREGKGDDEVVEAARKRFIGVDAEQARKIVDEVRVWCKP
ncbi:DUF732 domain-containing protein [Nonomuraea sp. SYSU D8015]|uniref:DUF732 domain-containing protein n=1 Tax=Nonomuraea sp. SYSU D8015 TaxID=2593644 RepID=UPI001660680E|nr:DUF732 domain-containing protein [Nonomuraea sp. SYSU D8015]